MNHECVRLINAVEPERFFENWTRQIKSEKDRILLEAGASQRLQASSILEHIVNALAPAGDEGRAKLR